jgi:oxygen-dependent protoporphyrinogen oxidase
MKKVIIVGAGVSGLTTGYRLRGEKDLDVQILEREEALGGRVRTVEVSKGFRADYAQFFSHDYQWSLGLLDEIGLKKSLIAINESTFFALYRDGRIWSMPNSVIGFMRCGGLRLREKLDLIRFYAFVELKRRRGALHDLSLMMKYDDVRMSEFFASNYAKDSVDHILSPLTNATYDAAGAVSLGFIMSLFPVLTGKHYTLRGGMGAFTERLAELGPPIRAGAPVTRIVIEEGRTRGVELAAGSEMLEADAVVCAANANHAAEMLQGLNEWQLGFLTGVEYSTCINVFLGTERPFLECWMLAIPETEGSFITFFSEETVKDRSRAPQGKGLTQAVILSERARRMAPLDDAEISRRTHSELRRLLPDYPEDLLFSHVTRHEVVIPLQGPGYQKRLAAFTESVRGIRGLHLSGDYTGSGIIEGAVQRGEETAKEILRRTQR